jgi:hypothetical protein
VVPIAYARAVCSSYEAGPPPGSVPSGRILEFKVTCFDFENDVFFVIRAHD